MKTSFIKLLCLLFPNKVVQYAYHQLTHPQIKKLRSYEIEVLNTSQKETLPFQGFDIQLYTWEGGPKSVMLIHGWEGQAGNFSDIIEALIKKNFTVYTFDGPSHGFSSKGNTHLFAFSDLVGLLIEKYQVKNLISHSFGSVATTYALYENPELKIDNYVLLTTPDKFSERIDDIATQVGISEKVKQKLLKKLEAETGKKVAELEVSRFVKSILVKKALIIHDKNDKVLPVQRSKNVYKNWDACEFWEVEETGHFRILRTPEVIEETIHFFN